jgi:hypothetical protein
MIDKMPDNKVNKTFKKNIFKINKEIQNSIKLNDLNELINLCQ